MKIFGIVIISLLPILSLAQDNKSIQAFESQMEGLMTRLRTATTDVEKTTINDSLRAIMSIALEKEEAFDYPFSKLTTIGVIDSPDGKLRIVNWNVEKEDFSHDYFCFVIHKDKRKDTSIVTELKDISFGMPTQPTDVLTADEWYGALYYKIIPVKKSGKTIYTVLGWDYYTDMSQVKLLDAIYVSGKSIKLGSSIFRMNEETLKRVFFEHSKKATMYLNYEDDRDRIMMDHLSPESPSMKNFREFYVPDLSYDAFVYERTRWVLKEDVIGVNKGELEKKKTIYTIDPETGKPVEKKIKNEWENPEDPGAPDGGSKHVSVTPEQDEASKNQDPPKELTKKEKRKMKNSSLFGDMEKKKHRKKKH